MVATSGRKMASALLAVAVLLAAGADASRELKTSACSPPPACSPVTVQSPPPTCYSPPPACTPVTVQSPPPTCYSPPPVKVHSPPKCYSPPPVKVHSPPACTPVTVKSPPPTCYSPTPVKVYSPPACTPVTVRSPPACTPVTVKSPPPTCYSPPPACTPVRVNSPPPACYSPPPACTPVRVNSPPPACYSPPPKCVNSPPPACTPVRVNSPPPACYSPPPTCYSPPPACYSPPPKCYTPPPCTNPCTSAYAYISMTPELSIFKILVDKYGMQGYLNSMETFTVFAPANSAFVAIDINSISYDQAVTIIKGHIVPGVAAWSRKCLDGLGLGTLSGSRLTIFNDGYKISVGLGECRIKGTVIKADIATCSGVIHIIDAVIMY